MKGWVKGGLVGIIFALIGLFQIFAYLVEHFCRYNLVNYVFSLPLVLSCKFSIFNLLTYEVLLVIVHFLFYILVFSIIGSFLWRSKK